MRTGADSIRRSASRAPLGPRPRAARRRASAGRAPPAARAAARRRPPSCRVQSAAHASSRSTRDRLGPRAARSTAVRVEAREPQRGEQPQRDGLAVRQLEAAAASSACANVWPRLSCARSPRSCGSRRQRAVLNAAERRTCSASGSSQSGSPASRPVLTTSARPFASSASGSVSSVAGSITVRTGQWKAPTRFLRVRQVDRRLAADRRVDLADERRRHGDPVDPAQVRRGGEAGDVGRAAAAERDERAAALQPQRVPQSARATRRVFACSPGGQLVARTRARSERELDVHAVDPGDARVADDLDRPLAGNELAEPLERAELDVDAARGEHGAVDVARSRIRGVVVERLPLLVQRPERSLVLRQRPVAAADAAPRLLGVDLDEDGDGAISRALERIWSVPTAPPPSATTAGVDRAPGRRPRASTRGAGTPPRRRSRRSARSAPPRSISRVDVDERPPEPLRERRAERRLAGAHEADQGDVTV